MNQKRKFENKKVFLINNAGQKSLYIGLLVLTFLILFIGKADLSIVNRVSVIISDLSAPAISSISKQTKIISNSFNYLKNTTSIREENKILFAENHALVIEAEKTIESHFIDNNIKFLNIGKTVNSNDIKIQKYEKKLSSYQLFSEQHTMTEKFDESVWKKK